MLPHVKSLKVISSWSTDDVIKVLRRNNLAECCEAVAKRQISGENLLNLTEDKLGLWKNDLKRPLICKLLEFVKKLNECPEQYLVGEQVREIKKVYQTNIKSSNTKVWNNEPKRTSVDSTRSSVDSTRSSVDSTRSSVDSTRSSVDSTRKHKTESNRNVVSYENAMEIKRNLQSRNQTQSESTKGRRNSFSGKDVHKNSKDNLKKSFPTTPPTNNTPTNQGGGHHFNSELEKKLKQRHDHKSNPSTPILSNNRKLIQKDLPNVPKPKFGVDNPQGNDCGVSIRKKQPNNINIERIRPKAPIEVKSTVENLDLVANLPIRSVESEDEYEPIDERVSNSNNRSGSDTLTSNNKQIMTKGLRLSMESIGQSPAPSEIEEEEKEEEGCNEIYECIQEMIEDPYHYPTSSRPLTQFLTAYPIPSLSKCSTFLSPLPIGDFNTSTERSPDKKSATLPHSGGSGWQGSADKATRPLPPPPKKQSYKDKPWYHNVTREEGTTMLRNQYPDESRSRNGCYLLRPSNKNLDRPLILMLWFNDRVFNIPVRRRPDNKYALGSEKDVEDSFDSIEQLVGHYCKHQLIVHSGDDTEGTTLTETPLKFGII